MNEIAEKLLQWMQSIENLTVEQLPEFANEILQYGFYENLFWAVLVPIFLLALVKARKKVYSYEFECPAVADSIYIGYTIVGCSVGIFAIIGWCFTARAMIKITFAPKLYLLEYVTRIIGR